MHDQLNYTHTEKDEAALLQAKHLTLRNFQFNERTYTLPAVTLELNYCHAMKTTLRLVLPKCETLKLKFYRLQQLYNIDWASLTQLKQLELHIDDFYINNKLCYSTFRDTISLWLDMSKIERLVIKLKS